MTNHAYSGGHVILVLGLAHGALGSRLGQGQAGEAGTQKSGVSGISLSRAEGAAWRRTGRGASGMTSGVGCVGRTAPRRRPARLWIAGRDGENGRDGTLRQA